MKTFISSLALVAAAFAMPSAHAQKAAMVQDVERPTAQSIVSAHCAQGNTLTCSVYTVPAGKILHVTQLGSLVKDANGSVFAWHFAGFTSLFHVVSGGYETRSDMVDLYVPAGTVINVSSSVSSSFLDISLFGTLSDQ